MPPRVLCIDGDRNFGVFTIGLHGADVRLTLEASAWACSSAEIRGSVAIVRL